MPGGQRLMLVDDEPDLCAMVAEYLGRHGYIVETAANGGELDKHLYHSVPDLIILDINLPGESGLDIARRIRARSDVPIIMLTAADEVIDRVVGLELGADDYVTKPFDLRELRARIQAVIRRNARAAVPATDPVALPLTAVRFGDFLLDLDSRRLMRDDGEEQELTAMEFDLLAAFAKNPNRVLSRERLLVLAHNRDTDPFDRSIDVRITRIRRKLERDPARPQVIKTMRGAGYMFVPTGP